MAQIKKLNDVELTTGNYCFYVGEVPNGGSFGRPGHYFPGIVVRGVAGYYCTDWDWGTDKDLAQSCCDDLNRERGLTPEQVNEIVCSSMFKGSFAKGGN
jgi:hypothetical protein